MKSHELNDKMTSFHMEITEAIVTEFRKAKVENIDCKDIPASDTPKILDPYAEEYFENLYVEIIAENGVSVDREFEVEWDEFLTAKDLLNILEFLENYNIKNYNK